MHPEAEDLCPSRPTSTHVTLRQPKIDEKVVIMMIATNKMANM